MPSAAETGQMLSRSKILEEGKTRFSQDDIRRANLAASTDWEKALVQGCTAELRADRGLTESQAVTFASLAERRPEVESEPDRDPAWTNEVLWMHRLRNFVSRGDWDDRWGSLPPEPGSRPVAGCEIPGAVMQLWHRGEIDFDNIPRLDQGAATTPPMGSAGKDTPSGETQLETEPDTAVGPATEAVEADEN